MGFMLPGPNHKAGAAESAAGSTVSTGRSLYEKHCAACHGVNGDGRGPAAYLLYPKPRDFTSGIYKFTSTGSGEAPVDADLMRTLRRGMPGTSMPSFGAILEPDELRAVVEYVRAFEPPHPEPRVIVSPKPEDLTVDPEAGKQHFSTLGCVQCHGEDGLADTPTAATLMDAWGEPNPPNPIRYGFFKGGGDLADVYRTILTGIKGTGMPSFASFLEQQTLSEQSFWNLAAYVLSLSEAERAETLSDENAELTVHRRSVAVSRDPWAAHWDEAPAVTLRLHPLWKRPEPPPPISIRAVHNGDSMALMMEWADATKDWSLGDPRFAPDAVAVQYPVQGDEAPFIGMGAEDLKSVVRIWLWQAHRQERITNHDFRDIEQAYPNMAVDWYPDERNRRIGERPTFKGNEDGLLNQAPMNVPAMAVGNPVIRRDLLDQASLEYLCQGYGTLTGLPPGRHFIHSKGVWLQGKWRVVMERPLDSGDPQDRVFRPGQSVWMALAAWDGFHGDRNGQKSVSRWVRFNFEE